MPNAEKLDDLLRQLAELRSASLSMAQQYDAERKTLVEHVENMAAENNGLRSHVMELQELVGEMKVVQNAQQEKINDTEDRDQIRRERDHWKRLYRKIYEELHGRNPP